MGTLDKFLAAWSGWKLVKGEYIGNCPWKPGSDSKSFCLKADTADQEHGTWIYFANAGESGSLYEACKRVGIDLPTEKPITETKKLYKGLEDYAFAHYVKPEVFAAAGWTEGKWYDHPALIYPTATGVRYRLLDATKGVYRSQDDYERCWYGFKYLNTIDKDVIVLCNGEPSTVVAQHYGVPALCVTGGEKALPDDLIKQLRAKWNGAIWIAYDCDQAGRTAAVEVERQLKAAGYQDVRILDLGLTDGGDLADFCGLYLENAYNALKSLLPLPVPTDSHAAAEHAIQTFSDVPTGRSILIPMNRFHELGGFARNISPKKVVFVAAPSAGGKTSFLETLADLLMMRGETGLFEGKEWSVEEYHARRIGRMGGLSFDNWLQWQTYKSDYINGLTGKDNGGREATPDEEKQFTQLSHAVTQWRGKLHYVREYLYIEDTLDEMEAKLAEARRIKQPISFAMFDYVNVYQVRSMGTERSGNNTEYIIGKIKRWTEMNNIVSFVGLQVTKDGSRDSRKNKLLDSDDLMYARDWQANLIITLNTIMKESDEYNPDGTRLLEKTPYVIANVCKNSAGKTGQVRIKYNAAQLRFENIGWNTTHVDIGNLE